MSNKPMKHSDLKKINSMFQKSKRAVEESKPLPPYTYIFSEGRKTEPYYISGLVDELNKKYQDAGTQKRFIVEGTGRNTRGLLSYARGIISKKYPSTQVIWLMYDKDDFPYDDFDNTQYSAEQKLEDNRTYRVAWSNECLELWFLLHFQDLSANIGRVEYRKKLDIHFKKLGYDKYDKSSKKIYSILKDKTDIAIKRAEKQYKEYNGAPPSQCCPATRVYELVCELRQYL